MNKTMLLAGKDYPDCSKFSNQVIMTGRNIVFTVSDANQNQDLTDVQKCVVWHKSSALSAKSIILQAESVFSEIDEAVLFFDEVQFSKQYQRLEIEDCTTAVNNLILSYQFLTMELLNRFNKKEFGEGNKKPGKLVFMMKTCPSVCDTVRSSLFKTKATSFANPVIATAAAAFTAFAENTAAYIGDRLSVFPVLVTWDESNETGNTDKTLASWICEYLTALDGIKSLPSAKQAASWIKPGAKVPGGLFSRGR